MKTLTAQIKCTLLSLFFCAFALIYPFRLVAQEKKAEAKLQLPESVELTAEESRQWRDLTKDAQIAGQQAEILALRIQQAQRDLAEFQKRAQETAEVANRFRQEVTAKRGIPKDKLSEYRPVDEKDKISLVRNKQQ